MAVGKKETRTTATVILTSLVLLLTTLALLVYLSMEDSRQIESREGAPSSTVDGGDFLENSVFFIHEVLVQMLRHSNAPPKQPRMLASKMFPFS